MSVTVLQILFLQRCPVAGGIGLLFSLNPRPSPPAPAAVTSVYIPVPFTVLSRQPGRFERFPLSPLSMSCSPEEPKASDAGGMIDEKEADEGKRKPTVEPCTDSSHDGEGGGDVAKEPELPPSQVAAPSSPLVASGSGIRLPEFFMDPDSTQGGFFELLELPPSPSASPTSSPPVASDSRRNRLRYFDSGMLSSTSSADPYPQEPLEEHGPEISLGGVEVRFLIRIAVGVLGNLEILVSCS